MYKLMSNITNTKLMILKIMSNTEYPQIGDECDAYLWASGNLFKSNVVIKIIFFTSLVNINYFYKFLPI